MAAFINSIENFIWNGDLKTGNTTSAKPKRVKTTYPQNPTWSNPGQVVMQLAQQPDVRQYFLAKMGQYNMPQLGQQDLWTQGQHINQSPSTGSPVTQVILQQDKTFISEAQKNNQVVQMLQRLRTELNTSNFNNFVNLANNGLVQTFQSLLSGGGISGLSGISGMAENLLSAFTSMGNQTVQTNANQNQAQSNNQIYGLNANGQPIYANGAIIPGANVTANVVTS